MIVVRGVEDGLIGCADARYAAYDIGADIAADAALDMGMEADRKFKGMGRSRLSRGDDGLI